MSLRIVDLAFNVGRTSDGIWRCLENSYGERKIVHMNRTVLMWSIETGEIMYISKSTENPYRAKGANLLFEELCLPYRFIVDNEGLWKLNPPPPRHHLNLDHG